MLFVGDAVAHLDAGEDISKNGYIIDLGYTPATIHTDEPANFVINFVNETTKERVNITSVWMRVLFKGEIIFAGELSPNNGGLVFTDTFHESGEYTLDLNFKAGDEVIEQQTFLIDVEKSGMTLFQIYLILAVILGAILFHVKKINRK